VKKKAKKVQKSVDKYMVLSVYLGMKNDNKKKGNEMSYLDDLQTTGFDQDNDLIGLDDRINESFNGEAESMAREQAMADMMLGGTEFDWQEMQDYANLVTDTMPEPL
jgi:hypothetical protein